VLVVAKNLIGRAGVEHGEGVYAAQEVFELAGQDAAAALGFESRPPFFKGSLDSLSYGFASLVRNLAGETLGFSVLNAEGHRQYYILFGLILYYNKCF
jgi:hypothetical protein